MTAIHLPAFYLGVKEELEKISRCWEGYEPVPGKEAYSEDSCRPKRAKKKEKKAFDVSSMPANENIIPSLTGQAKWKYVRTKDGLRLSDGNLVYSFGGFPESFPAEDTQISRGEDDNILNFDKDAISKGTAQIHRASPDNIYMTLANGADNPTFILQHEQGKNWRYSPSKKFLEKLKKVKESLPAPTESDITVSPEALLAGGQAEMKKLSFDLGDISSEHAHPAAEALSSLRNRNIEGTLGLVTPYHAPGAYDAASFSDLLSRGAQGLSDTVTNRINYTAAHPIAATLQGYAITKGLDLLKDKIWPEKADRRAMDPDARRRHELIPIAGALIPTLASMAVAAK